MSNKRLSHRQDMFAAVNRFCTAHKAKFPANKLSGQSAAIVAECATGLDDVAKGKVVHVGEELDAAASGGVLYDALRKDVMRVVRTARDGIALDEPGFEKNFPAPADSTASTLVTTARAFLEGLADPATLKKFTDHELKETVLDRLEVNADDLEASDAKQQDAGTGHVTATSTADRLIRRGMKACLRLDVIVENLFDDEPETLGEWTRARHTVRVPVTRPRKVRGTGTGLPAAGSVPA